MAKRTRNNEAKWEEKQNRWKIHVQARGMRRSFYSPTPGRKGKIEAERKADAWLDSSATDDPRFSDAWAEFLEDTKARTGTSNYKKHESAGRIWILPRLKNRRVSSITIQDMQNVINAAYGKGLAKKSLKNLRASFSAFSAYLRKRRIRIDSTADIQIPRDAVVGEKEILQPDDVKILFSVDHVVHYGRQKRPIYIHAWRFAVLTGLRPGELYGLKKGDIKDGVISIRRAYNTEKEFTRGKNDTALRWFLLPDCATSVLTDQEDMLKELGIISPWIFPDERGQVTSQHHAYALWRTYREQHGIRSSPYEMRHTMVSITGADLPEKFMKDIVGHTASMDTLGTYGHRVDGEMQRAKLILDSVFERLFE